jgi:hypothetical protein
VSVSNHASICPSTSSGRTEKYAKTLFPIVSIIKKRPELKTFASWRLGENVKFSCQTGCHCERSEAILLGEPEIPCLDGEMASSQAPRNDSQNLTALPLQKGGGSESNKVERRTRKEIYILDRCTLEEFTHVRLIIFRQIHASIEAGHLLYIPIEHQRVT